MARFVDQTIKGGGQLPPGAVVTPTPPPTSSPGAITIDPLVTRSGDVLTFTARRTANLPNAESRPISVAGSTGYLPAAIASDFGGGFPAPVALFAAGSAIATFAITSSSAVPE